MIAWPSMPLQKEDTATPYTRVGTRVLEYQGLAIGLGTARGSSRAYNDNDNDNVIVIVIHIVILN